MRLPSGKLISVDLRLDVGPFEVAQRGDLDLVVEMADIADDRHVLHLAHMLDGDDVLVARRGDDDVRRGATSSRVTTSIAVHGSLQGADRIDLGDLDAGAGAAQRRRRTLADVAVTADDRHLAGHHDVACARRMPSTSDSLQPYLLSNFDFVTESLTLIAGNGSRPFFCS